MNVRRPEWEETSVETKRHRRRAETRYDNEGFMGRRVPNNDGTAPGEDCPQRRQDVAFRRQRESDALPNLAHGREFEYRAPTSPSALRNHIPSQLCDLAARKPDLVDIKNDKPGCGGGREYDRLKNTRSSMWSGERNLGLFTRNLAFKSIGQIDSRPTELTCKRKP